MARIYKFRCTRCGRMPGETREQARANLFVKRVEFREYGFRGAPIRARAVAWLCRSCMTDDPDFNRPEREVSDRMVD